VKIIEDKGLVSVIQGRGSTVQPSDGWNSLDAEIIAGQMGQADNRHVFEDLTAVRVALECEMAAGAAARLTSDLEERMRAAIESEGGQADDPEGFLQYDYEFHRLVTEASGNRIGRGIMASLEAPLLASRRVTSQLPGAFQSAHGHHQAVLQAILDRDPDQARRAMRAHLRDSSRMFRESAPSDA
jgi:GntR family galactonate operon transcriptional repressor